MPLIRVPLPDPIKPFATRERKKATKSLKRKRDTEELEALEKRVQEFAGTNANLFSDLPLTKQTLGGLHKAHFKSLTDIQRKALPLALKGRDVLGAAQTGSGKTLAFLIPVLEILYRKKWTPLDGLGALIISPTRELATQIFEVLRKIGREHAFSAGLVIGGKSLKDEQDALHKMNIVVCTPGRMLQHLDQTVGLSVDDVQLLVLDEADRCLDMGFKSTIDAIVANLPKKHQTLLFSATQTKNVGDLARLNLKDAEYVSVHEKASTSTPAELEQFYMITPLPEKLDILYSFLRNHLKTKIVVFMSSCKQVRFVYETFRQLHIGIPLLHLHGKQKQSARADITARFSAAKESCLFATDVVARGLDFPAVDWVLQIDAPEDADTYIHRVGRTARFQRNGKALLFLCPSEETGFLQRLEAKKVPVVRINAKASKKQSITNQLQGLCFKDPELKYLGQKAFVSYAKSVGLRKDREVFKIDELPLEGFATSLGLPGAPRIRGLKSTDAGRTKELKNQPRGLRKLEEGKSNEESVDEDAEEGEGAVEGKKKDKKKEVRTKYDRMVERQNQNVLADHYSKMVHSEDASDNDDENFLKIKRSGYSSSEESSSSSSTTTTTKPQILLASGKSLTIDSKRREKLLKSKKLLTKLKPRGTKLVFDDDGNSHAVYELQDETGFRKEGDAQTQRVKFLEAEGERVKVADVEDRVVAKEKRKIKREKRKQREAEEEAAGMDSDGDGDEDGGVRLGAYVSDEVMEDGESEVEQKGSKRQRKWFEDDEEKEEERKKKTKGKVIEDVEEPETLEDLEALASGLLG